MIKFTFDRIDIFLSVLSLIYVSSFSSILIQSKGLYGDNGILPVRKFVSDPSLFINYIYSYSGFKEDDLNLIIIVGLIVSSFAYLFKCCRTKIVYLILWTIYFTIYQIGQTFLWFQWDILLLETGIIAILLPQCYIYGAGKEDNENHASSVSFWLVKWLIFRLMFASGVVKLTSNCPTWWGLTALNWHYESQCIPTFLAWFAHKLPQWFHSLCVAVTFFIEIMVPILFFVPMRPIQLFSFCSQIHLQIMIILSGNYNFFNLLTMTLCLSLLPRSNRFSKSENAVNRSRIFRYVEEITSAVIIAWFFHQLVYYCGIGLDTDKYAIKSKINFSKNDFKLFLEKFVPISIYVAAASLSMEIVRAVIKTVKICGFFNKIRHLTETCFVSLIVVGIFCVSLVPYTTIERGTHARLPRNIGILYESVSRYEIVNSYGLFRSMTGVGGRPEIIIEGSNSIHGPWKEYEFLYKPGNLTRAPPFIIPHQPRLDWQMWFAALGSYQHNPWLINLLYRLLRDEKSVIQLLDHNPFPGAPPVFVRVGLYHYHYTTFDESRTSNVWWKREFVQEYLPAISAVNEGLLQYVRDNDIDHIFRKNTQSLGLLSSIIRVIMDHLDQTYGHLFVWAILCANIVLKLLLTKVFFVAL